MATRLLGRRPVREAAHAAYLAIVERAREPLFYERHGVPDTLDGRFELIALHAFLVLHRIRGLTEFQPFGQALFDALFSDMDRGLREMGTGDLSVGKQVKRMATALYGRMAAYGAGVEGRGELEEALRRNLFGTVAEPDQAAVAWFSRYVKTEAAALAERNAAEIAAGHVSFAPLDQGD